MTAAEAILSDDRPEQFALMDGPLTSLPPGLGILLDCINAGIIDIIELFGIL